jgi:hypothetical protein
VDGAPFEAIELQQLEHDSKVANSVVVHRGPGQLELYVEPSTDIDEAMIRSDPAFAHFDVVHFAWTDFPQTRYQTAGGELDALVVFTDSTGVEVEVRVRHRSSRRPKPLFTPAPPQDKPENLRFLVLNDFRLLPTRSSQVSVVVDGVAATPSPMMVPSAKLAPLLSARSGSEMFLVSLAPAHQEIELPLARPGQTDLGGGVSTEVVPGGLRSIKATGDHGQFAVCFDPPLPDLGDEPPARASGTLTVVSSLGEVATGRWQLTFHGGGATLELVDLAQDWFPGLGQPLRLLLRQARKRRRRDQHWHYRAALTPGADGTWTSTGAWI